MPPRGPTEPPPCIYCLTPDAKDVTPDSAEAMDRWYECAHCFRRFVVRFHPLFTDRPAF